MPREEASLLVRCRRRNEEMIKVSVCELKRIRKEIKDLEKALTLKPYNGSIVMEKVRCGKRGCTKCPHGPYAYLHYYDSRSGKVKRKYLGKNVSEFYEMAREEIFQRIEHLRREEAEILGQVEIGREL